METKTLTLNLQRWSHRRKLQKLLKQGWTIASEHKRSWLQWKPGWIDYVLTRQK